MGDLFGGVPDLGRSRSITSPRRQPPTRGPKRPRAPSPKASNTGGLMTITLKRLHKINGTPYAGTVTVPRDVARVLLENEGYADAEQERFQGEHAVIIGAKTPTGHHLYRVPYEAFDAYNASAPPMETLSGRGAPPNPAGTPEF